MSKTEYGWNGWKMPFLHPDDPDYCESGCPVCTKARKGNRLARFLQRIEMVVTLGGCPWGRAREKEYGVKPTEPIPKESNVDGTSAEDS